MTTRPLPARPPRRSLTRRGCPSRAPRVFRAFASLFRRRRRSHTRATVSPSSGRSWLAGGGSRSLEALLEYNEETADYQEVAISIPSGPLHQGDLTTGTSFEFELALPPDALPNYQSR